MSDVILQAMKSRLPEIDGYIVLLQKKIAALEEDRLQLEKEKAAIEAFMASRHIASGTSSIPPVDKEIEQAEPPRVKRSYVKKKQKTSTPKKQTQKANSPQKRTQKEREAFLSTIDPEHAARLETAEKLQNIRIMGKRNYMQKQRTSRGWKEATIKFLLQHNGATKEEMLAYLEREGLIIGGENKEMNFSSMLSRDTTFYFNPPTGKWKVAENIAKKFIS